MCVETAAAFIIIIEFWLYTYTLKTNTYEIN